MTDPTRQRSAGRPSASSGMAWKSGALGVSIGAVLLGWGLLARDGAASSATPAPTQQQIIVVRVPVQEWPDSGSVAVVSQSLTEQQPAVVDIAPLPQRPVFRQPITRTRGS